MRKELPGPLGYLSRLLPIMSAAPLNWIAVPVVLIGLIGWVLVVALLPATTGSGWGAACLGVVGVLIGAGIGWVYGGWASTKKDWKAAGITTAIIGILAAIYVLYDEIKKAVGNPIRKPILEALQRIFIDPIKTSALGVLPWVLAAAIVMFFVSLGISSQRADKK